MGKPLPAEPRERVVAFLKEGHSHQAAAARFRVSEKFVNDLVTLQRETGGLEPRARGIGGGSDKLVSLQDWIAARMDQMPDLALNDLVRELADHHGVFIHRVPVWRFLRGLGLAQEKDRQGEPSPPTVEWKAPAPGVAMCPIGCCYTNPGREPLTKEIASVGLEPAPGCATGGGTWRSSTLRRR